MTRKKNRKGFRRFPNGYGSITKLSGNRRRPYMVKVNTKLDERGYPTFDILGYFEDEKEALIALAEYNKNPYDLASDKLTFKQVYEMWYKQKYETGKRKYSASSIGCTTAAYNKISKLHNIPIKKIRVDQMQELFNDYTISHAYMEHMLNLLHQVFNYAMKYDYIEKDYSKFVQITKEDDDEHGIPFTDSDIEKLWKNKRLPYVDTILILIYSGWRINELLNMKKTDVDIVNMTFTGGSKTKAGKNRIVPIHSAIQSFVKKYYETSSDYLICNQKNKKMSYPIYMNLFRSNLNDLNITTHTPHDCRHTFASLLNTHGANIAATKLLLGHSSGDITERIYTHKSIEELRENIELIKVNSI